MFMNYSFLEVELVETAVIGTLNVLKACSEAKIKRVVVVSSTAAVEMNPNWPNDQVMDEACWSDEEYCRKTKNWYFLSKTVAEKEALEYGRRTDGLEVVTVCPSIVIGPMLQSTVNGSSWVLIKILKDGVDRVENKVLFIVDVREVAEALLLTYEKPEAEGRYICSSYMVRMRDLVEKLRSVYPNYNYPKNFIEVKEEKISSEKLQRMGWKFRSLEETLADSVKSYQEAGVIHRC
ncbi:hypothetical protein Sjap_009643 [Stephania japonica]|uniref:NAD-dependent epimerase/dehydratase domain-containing protein n=1 Tax=Stephania japonica TaxID=461633 RepID=A0AAP0J805_9MAGN